MSNFKKIGILVLVGFAALHIIAAIVITPYFYRYEAAKKAAHADFAATHTGLGTPGSIDYLTIGVRLGDDEKTVDGKLAKAEISNQLYDSRNPRGFTKRYRIHYGKPFIHPDRTEHRFIVETFFVYFDEKDTAYAINRDIYIEDGEINTVDIDLKSKTIIKPY